MGTIDRSEVEKFLWFMCLLSSLQLSFSLKVLYSCSMRDESNKEQLKLVKKTCQGFEACQLDATRQYFGNDECPGTEDEKMALWLEYSCVGGTDRTTTRAPICNGIEPPSGPPTGPVFPCKGGKRKQLDVRGCGGWINLDCKGGCLNIRKV